VDECQPLPPTRNPSTSLNLASSAQLPSFRGIHSFTSQLNFSALYGTGGARRGCVAHVKGVLGGI